MVCSILNTLVNYATCCCAGERKYHRVDTLVHEFCRTGVPEYASGVVSFPDFFELKTSTSNNDDRAYYQTCSKVRLHRQVGRRYFITAANACKIVFLKDAAIKFLKFTGKDSGDRLDRDVYYTKLQNPIELAHLKADSLMYYHVYGDLYMLSKSNDLGSTMLSMNQHYLELQTYLSEVEKSPQIVLNTFFYLRRGCMILIAKLTTASRQWLCIRDYSSKLKLILIH